MTSRCKSSVLDILINHSYLAGQMKAAMKDGMEMPEEVKALLRVVKATAGGKEDHNPAVAPIP